MTSKPVYVALVAGLVGLLAGYEITARVFFPKLAAHSISSEQRYAAVISLGALNKLESGEVEKAKSLLAREVIGYSRASFGASLPQREQIGPLIKAAIEKSPALKEELGKEQK
jgi:hypothetical protein